MVLGHTPVSAGIDPSRARNCLMQAEIVEMVVEPGLARPFSLQKPSIFCLRKPIFGGSGGIRTYDQLTRE